MSDVKKTRRGVYLDLNQSPYVCKSPYGDLFRFSSQKKLEIYTRDVEKEIKRLDDLLDRHNLRQHIPNEIVELLKRSVYKSFYHSVKR